MHDPPRHAFHPDPAKPLAESILPIANGQYVCTMLYPFGVFTLRGMLDQDGEFIAHAGSFRGFRPDQERK